MKAVKKIIVVVLTLALMSMTLVACGNKKFGPLNLVKEDVLTVASDCDYPPFIEMANGEPAGFEYELLEAVAADMGLELEYLDPRNFDTLVPLVAANVEVDLACSSITINDLRKETIDFSDPYFDSNQACVVMSDSGYDSLEDLENMAVGAQAGTTGLDWANENIPGITMKPYNQASEGLQALQAGQIEAMFFDEPSAFYQVTENYEGMEIIDVIATGEQYGFAVSKDNPELQAAINESLQNVIDNGTYATIFKKYFPYMEPSIG